MFRMARLGVNIDHVATLRNARGGFHPCPVGAAQLAQKAGADGITAHLREDRRHVRDEDIARLKGEVNLPLNLEMAATEEMVSIALKTKPNAVCLVPEKRAELTTEGGLDVAAHFDHIKAITHRLKEADIRVSLFINADREQIEAASLCGADIVELHTGHYCDTLSLNELNRLISAAQISAVLGLECHAGHGINYDTVAPIAAIPEIMELNIGHFLIGAAIFMGLEDAIRMMRHLMDNARA